jgi:pyruvate/2-oxoglutarate/acetoin dehydrogenase E1 component
LVQDDYYDRPWQILDQDSALLRKAGNALQSMRDAGRRGAVVVHIIIQGPDNGAWRHQEVEQHLVELLTGRGAVVSVIAPTGPTEAQSMLYRPSPDGEPTIVLEKFDLTPYLLDYSNELQR